MLAHFGDVTAAKLTNAQGRCPLNTIPVLGYNQNSRFIWKRKSRAGAQKPAAGVEIAREDSGLVPTREKPIQFS